MQTPIILIGPICAGKTTVGEKVAKKHSNIFERNKDFKACTPIGSRLKLMPLKEY
ncbi:hypothetical protein ABEU98_18170 [Priestia megaterium]